MKLQQRALCPPETGEITHQHLTQTLYTILILITNMTVTGNKNIINNTYLIIKVQKPIINPFPFSKRSNGYKTEISLLRERV